MSPSESELRAALHRGEGEPLDADAVIAQARAARRSRRTTIGAVAGSVVAVAAIATSAVVLSGGNSNGHGQQAAPPPAATQTQPTPASPQTGGSPSPQQTGGTTAACRSRPPRVMTPPGNQFGANEPLFPSDVTKITVCVYQSDGSMAGSFSLSGADASTLAKTLNALPEPGNQPCTADLGPTVVLLPDHGRQVVGNAGGCGLITNGTAKRAGRDALIALISKAVLHTIPPGRMSHGPVPS